MKCGILVLVSIRSWLRPPFQRCVVSMILKQLLALLHDCGTGAATFVLAQLAVAIKSLSQVVHLVVVWVGRPLSKESAYRMKIFRRCEHHSVLLHLRAHCVCVNTANSTNTNSVFVFPWLTESYFARSVTAALACLRCETRWLCK